MYYFLFVTDDICDQQFLIRNPQKMVTAVSVIYPMYSIPFVTDNISD